MSVAVDSSLATRERLPVSRSLWLLMLIPLLVGVAFVFHLPAYSAPDESAHVAYISALSQGHLPVLPTSRTVDVAAGVTYEAFHPPLYYAVVAPFYALARADPLRALQVARLLNVVFFLGVVWLVNRLARVLLDDPRAVQAATAIVATHPVLLYMSSVVTNEVLGLVLSLGCVLAALMSRRRSHRNLWLLLCVFCGGMALLVRFTAIAGVMAAAFVAAEERSLEHSTSAKRSVLTRLGTGAGVFCGSLVPWLLWSAYFRATHGTHTAPDLIPAFTGGPQALLWFPIDALQIGYLTLTQLGNGLTMPAWLMHNPYSAHPLLVYGFPLSLWLLWLAWRQQPLRFVVPAYATLAALLVGYTFFIDLDDAITGSRFASPVIIYLALPVACEYARSSRKMQLAFAGLWLVAAVLTVGHTFHFFG